MGSRSSPSAPPAPGSRPAPTSTWGSRAAGCRPGTHGPVGLLESLYASSDLARGGGGGAVDWGTVGTGTVELLRRYLTVDTTNPPGNEIAGARFLAEILAA